MELVCTILDVSLKKECKLNQTSKSRILFIVATVHCMPAVCLVLFFLAPEFLFLAIQ